MFRVELTLFGRSLLLISALALANAVCWIVAGILFGRKSETQPILSLALLAWTLGLRHALDADHISAIDNATRGLINLGQLPVTCGLFFSLGHSTIVIVVNVAIAISSDIYNHLEGVGTVGGIVGAAVSGSFLFIVGLANSIILWRIIKQRQRDKRRREQGLAVSDELEGPKHNHMLMMRILGPVITFVNQPWKMYPVGILFGFGFDTASSIALLAVSALGRKGSGGSSIPSADIVILPLLFTAGMTLIDSADSILMLYSYSDFPERSWAVIFPSKKFSGVEQEETPGLPETPRTPEHTGSASFAGDSGLPLPHRAVNATIHAPDEHRSKNSGHLENSAEVDTQSVTRVTRELRVKQNVMSGLSIVLTLMSIFVAFSISLITIIGLIGDQCGKCQEAANAEDGGGLAGKWWRGWANANDNSGYIGAAVVGAFVVVVACWYAGRRLRRRGRREETSA
ncbi:high-affinity nickel-transport protein-domain-containing protein [Mycena sp. CBHHK59/15]|nr:high-affinity nickel-transport protein-domain-containing protein [Mycena sp. CBHHK59/15]